MKEYQMKDYNKDSWYNLFIKYVGTKVALKPILFYILNFTWGILLTLVGYILMLILLPFGNVKRFNYILYFEFKKKKRWGFSIGTVFFVGNNASESTKKHEFGHTVHNAILGPFMIFLVSIPSAIRFWYRAYNRQQNILPKTKYDDIWFEYTASIIGLRYSLRNIPNFLKN